MKSKIFLHKWKVHFKIMYFAGVVTTVVDFGYIGLTLWALTTIYLAIHQNKYQMATWISRKQRKPLSTFWIGYEIYHLKTLVMIL